MKHASEDLRNEHEAILFTLRVMEAVNGRIRAGEPVPREDLAGIVDFLKIFADKCHHGKEEGFFFPALEQAGIPSREGPIAALLEEHRLGRDLLRRMSDALADRPAFAGAASDYVELLRRHIEAENTVLFPLADRRLPEEAQRELLARFETFEDEVIGKGRHEELHRQLDEFEKKYL